jgi:hypothetical protein
MMNRGSAECEVMSDEREDVSFITQPFFAHHLALITQRFGEPDNAPSARICTIKTRFGRCNRGSG